MVIKLAALLQIACPGFPEELRMCQLQFEREGGTQTTDLEIGPSGCVRCHGNKVSTINSVIFLSLSLLSAGLLFSQKGLS